ncbi:predicted transmembrane transcriptional regulator [Microbacterium testaceum StLB037]|uniref:Predicted transmembrane transcriptional regulator n=1 Tax=Microbacterium testaceum (strain StLB037) TaxID=979556 RepID=E8NBC8_MICTS|nr:zf-HC2 domain-containing protein [Microbacterium testaceum]BAJ75985.1 predicted transmembrane transcriptional regulator [Microbacterium testaceum StLB037]
MSAEHERLSSWDGAYVLGALSAADRAEYEAHLAVCAPCRKAVAELAPTAGLLSRLSAERARAIAAPDGPAPVVTPHPSLRTRVVQTARRRRARRITAWTLAASLAVVAIAVPTVITVTNASSSSSGVTYALDEVNGAPLEASVKLTPVAWGTRIDLVCQYTGEVLDAPPGGWPYALAVTDDSGATSVLSTWRAGPGATTELSAGTDLEASSIGSIEIRSVDGDRVVMRRDFSTP